MKSSECRVPSFETKNMKIQCFEDIIAWQKARELTSFVYIRFKHCKDFGFKDQIQRAVVSVMNNIAEGYERNGTKEFMRYLNISKASCAEVKSMMYLAKDLNYMSDDDFFQAQTLTDEVARIIRGFMSSLQTRHSALGTRH